jgi:hypothetical protein
MALTRTMWLAVAIVAAAIVTVPLILMFWVSLPS